MSVWQSRVGCKAQLDAGDEVVEKGWEKGLDAVSEVFSVMSSCHKVDDEPESSWLATVAYNGGLQRVA